MQQGNRPQAQALVRRAVALKPDDAVAQKMLESFGAAPAAPEAGAAAPSAVAAAQPPADPISTPTIAEIYIRQGFLGRAMKVYRDLLQADPHNNEIRQKLVELKQRIETQQASPLPVETAAPAVPVAAAPVPAAEVPAAAAVEDARQAVAARQLAVLTCWLDSISRRRADVQ
jgi:hypothetical protein